MRIYRKIRQIREIVEYRRFALFVLPGQPLKQQSGSQNGIDELLKTDARHHFKKRSIHTFRYQSYGLQKCCMKPEQPLFSLVLEPAQRAAFTYSHNALAQRDFGATRETTRRLGSWLFGWERDLSD